jgi:hypothetical protein
MSFNTGSFNLMGFNVGVYNLGPFIYTYDNDSEEISIVGYDDSGLKEDLIIPDYIKHEGVDRVVTIIGDGSFEGKGLFGSVTFPETIISIGMNAFKDNNIMGELVIPSSVLFLGDGAFSYNLNLSRVRVENPNLIFGFDVFLGNMSVGSPGILYGSDTSTAKEYVDSIDNYIWVNIDGIDVDIFVIEYSSTTLSFEWTNVPDAGGYSYSVRRVIDDFIITGGVTDDNFLEVVGLTPDTQYRLDLIVNGGVNDGREYSFSVFTDEEGELFLGHPADINRDWFIQPSEASAYISLWFSGSVLASYASRVVSIWFYGSTYERLSGIEEPLCWVNV